MTITKGTWAIRVRSAADSAFPQRRKMMLKLLKQDWAVDKLAAAFAELKISPQERAEKLSLEQFVALTKILFSYG